ncbi:unnamed protein product [Phyllotreta striolata]|uniref:GH16 domain-containing protein n=1 Tax=Phyllotreta striolata TaxID=444603 RepID=A0A9N9TKW5_PHYSR|nr:unnamed protein product [Phyllotreta striolata]
MRRLWVYLWSVAFVAAASFDPTNIPGMFLNYLTGNGATQLTSPEYSNVYHENNRGYGHTHRNNEGFFIRPEGQEFIDNIYREHKKHPNVQPVVVHAIRPVATIPLLNARFGAGDENSKVEWVDLSNHNQNGNKHKVESADLSQFFELTNPNKPATNIHVVDPSNLNEFFEITNHNQPHNHHHNVNPNQFFHNTNPHQPTHNHHGEQTANLNEFFQITNPHQPTHNHHSEQPADWTDTNHMVEPNPFFQPGNRHENFQTNPNVNEGSFDEDAKDEETETKECKPSLTHVKGKSKCQDKLIFNENFKSLRHNVWKIEQKIATAPDYEFVVYVDRPETRQIINGGGLEIKPVMLEELFGRETLQKGIDLGKNCTVKEESSCKMVSDAGFMVPPVASALLTTKGKFSFKYGRVEIRAKLPAGDWVYPILYLNPMRELYGKDFESGQIRIAFTEGNSMSNRILKGGIILGKGELARNYGLRNVTSERAWADDFHNFQLKWTPDEFVVSVDGTEYGRIEPPKEGFVSLANELKIDNSGDWINGSPLAPFDKEMCLEVGVGVGGFSFDDRSDGTKPWRNRERLQVKKFYDDRAQWLPTWKKGSSMIIDYIKIWAL